MKTLPLLLMIVAVIFLSGCSYLPGVSVSTTGQAAGVVIKSFKPDTSEVFSGDIGTFSVSVQNIGEEDANNVQATIYGLGTDWTPQSEMTQTIGDLPKAQPQVNVPGGEGDATWDFKSPEPLSVDNTYTAGVRVSYGYNTTARATIKVYSQDYLKTVPDQSQQITSSSGIASFTVTNSPITVSLSGLARPLIYKGSTTPINIVTIQISNVGQGSPYLGADSNQGNSTISIDSITVNGKQCDNSADIQKTAKIPRDGSKAITCKFTLDAVTGYTTIPLEISLSYRYFVDSSTSIKVLKSIQ